MSDDFLGDMDALSWSTGSTCSAHTTVTAGSVYSILTEERFRDSDPHPVAESPRYEWILRVIGFSTEG